MSVPTVSLDENSPAGSDSISLGDNRIREYKTQNREVLEIDHNYPSSGQDADAGKHKKVSLIEQADIGSGATGKPILGAQTINGKAELVFTDEDDNDIQLTKAGKAYPSQSTTLADWSTIMNLVYPVGFVVTLGVSTNPGTLFGVGTWTAIAGKVIVGIDAGQTEFDTLDETGGSKTHTLTESEIPAHTHTIATQTTTNGGGAGDIYHSNAATTGNKTSGSTGGGGAHNNLQPYIVKYVWQRTA